MDLPDRRLEQKPQVHSRLLGLADELILSIIDQIDSKQALCSFILTCQKAQDFAEPYLYREVVIRHGIKAEGLYVSTFSDPRRCQYVQQLDIRYKAEGHDGIGMLNGFGEYLLNLQSLRIESPCPNDSIAFAFTREFGSGAGVIYYWQEILDLQNLKSLQIHTHLIDDMTSRRHHEGSYFDLCDGEASVIFKHPSIQQVHLSCADITPDSVRLLKAAAERTPLEELVFEECNIDPDALKLILARPRALKRLTLGERLHHFHNPPSGYLTEAGNGLAEALSLQASSLEHFKQTQQVSHVLLHWNELSSSQRRRIFSLPADLPDFPNLQELDIPYGSPLIGIGTKRPPRLRKVRIHDFSDHLPREGLYSLERELKLLERTSVEELEIVLMEARTQREDTEKQWLKTLVGPRSKRSIWRIEYNRAQLWEFAQKLRKNDVHLKVNWVRSAGYIPPYMCGEILPTEFTVYDANSPNTFGHVPSGNFVRDVDCEQNVKLFAALAPHLGMTQPMLGTVTLHGQDDEEIAVGEGYAFM